MCESLYFTEILFRCLKKSIQPEDEVASRKMFWVKKGLHMYSYGWYVALLPVHIS